MILVVDVTVETMTVNVAEIEKIVKVTPGECIQSSGAACRF